MTFSRRARRLFGARSVLLYGSLARNDYHQGSDVDLIVISDNLPANFMKRLELLQKLAPAGLPVEALGYTAGEFERMIREIHPTALSALEDGQALFDDGFYLEAQTLYRSVRRKTGLRRTQTGWVAERFA